MSKLPYDRTILAEVKSMLVPALVGVYAFGVGVQISGEDTYEKDYVFVLRRTAFGVRFRGDGGYRSDDSILDAVASGE